MDTKIKIKSGKHKGKVARIDGFYMDGRVDCHIRSQYITLPKSTKWEYV